MHEFLFKQFYWFSRPQNIVKRPKLKDQKLTLISDLDACKWSVRKSNHSNLDHITFENMDTYLD